MKRIIVGIAIFSSVFCSQSALMAVSESNYPSGKHYAVYPCCSGIREYQLYVDYPWYSEYFYQQESDTGSVQENVYSGATFARANCTEQSSTGGSVSVSFSYTLSQVSTEAEEIATKIGAKSGTLSSSIGTSASWSLSTSSATTFQISGSYDWGTVDSNSKKWITPYLYVRTTTGAKYAYNKIDACLYSWTDGSYCGSSFKVNDIYSRATESISYPVEFGIEENSVSGCGSSATFSQIDRSSANGILPTESFVEGKNWSQPYYYW
jgi:hypothetical protein